MTFPSILEWEKQFRGLARGKAPGADGLCSEHYHSAPAAFTECTFPIALKAAVTGTEPLKWKGGIAFPLYKQKGDSSDPHNHRSILLAENARKKISPMGTFRLLYRSLTESVLLFMQAFQDDSPHLCFRYPCERFKQGCRKPASPMDSCFWT